MRPDGFAPKVPVRVTEQRLQRHAINRVQTFQRPQRRNAFPGRLRLVADEALQLGGQFRHRSVGNGLPGEMALSGVLTAEFGEEFVAGELCKIGDGERGLVFVFHAPDAAALLVALGVVARDFVVRDDFIVPVHDVEAAVGAEPERHGAEHLVAGLNEVRQFLQAIARPIAMDFDGLDFSGDGVRDIHHVGVGSGPGGFVRKRQTAQARPAHLKIGRSAGKLGGVTLELRVGAARVVRVFVERHRRVAVVVGLLNPGFALGRHRQPPDVARAL